MEWNGMESYRIIQYTFESKPIKYNLYTLKSKLIKYNMYILKSKLIKYIMYIKKQTQQIHYVH